MKTHETIIWEAACQATRLSISKCFSQEINESNIKSDNAILRAVADKILQLELPNYDSKACSPF